MCQVHCPIKEESSLNEPSPPAKKQKTSTLANFIAKGNKQEEFLRDLVTAFAASNIPFEKLKKKEDGTTTLLRQFLDKYVQIDGEVPSIPDPKNLRANHLLKVREVGMLYLIFKLI